MSILKTLARAAWDAQTVPGCYDAMVAAGRDVSVPDNIARTLLQSLHDNITEEMITAGIIERHGQPCPEAWSLATANIFQAMITAAMNGDKPNG